MLLTHPDLNSSVANSIVMNIIEVNYLLLQLIRVFVLIILYAPSIYVCVCVCVCVCVYMTQDDVSNYQTFSGIKCFNWNLKWN